jgi:predicted O-methyltransferase YrrM
MTLLGALLGAAMAAALVALGVELRRQQRRLRRLERRVRTHHDALAAELRQQRALIELAAGLGARAPLPPMTDWAVAPDLGRLLVETVLDLRPATVVECGSGTSTVLIAYALERLGSGRVVALEHDPAQVERTERLLDRHGLQRWATVRHAPLVPHAVGDATFRWYDLAAVPLADRVDLLFVDGPPGGVQPLARYPAVPLLRNRLGPGAVVLLDDAGRADERAVAERWAAELPELALELVPCAKGAAVLRRRT